MHQKRKRKFSSWWDNKEVQLRVTMISTFKCWYQIKLSRPLTTHNERGNVWVWPVSHVMLVTKTRVRLARWSQEKSGPIVMSDATQRWRRQPDDTRALSWQLHETLFITSCLCRVSVRAAGNQLLVGTIFSGTVRCYEGSGGEIVWSFSK